jgi:putative oxidoreductase
MTTNPIATAGAADVPAKKSSLVTTIVRYLLGLPLVVFGLNGFLNFIPPPKTPMPEKAMAFAGALFNSGYMMQLIGATLLIVGVLLVLNRFVPLALALFAPFIVNSVAFHIFLERSGLPMAIVFLALELYLAWAYRNAFRPMLAARVSPA